MQSLLQKYDRNVDSKNYFDYKKILDGGEFTRQWRMVYLI